MGYISYLVYNRLQVSYWAANESRDELVLSGAVLRVWLCDLAAYTLYHAHVAAATGTGPTYGPAAVLSTWTEIASPRRPPAPRLNATGPGSITVIVEPAATTSDAPISAYFIVIEPRNSPSEQQQQQQRNRYTTSCRRFQRKQGSHRPQTPPPVLPHGELL